MSWLRLGLCLLVGCQVEVGEQTAELAVEAAPVPYGTLTFSGPSFVAEGETGTFTVTGANPRETLFLARSLAGVGSGPCPRPLGGQCLSLLAPVQVATNTSADLGGTATFVLPLGVLPVGAAPSMQVVAIRGLNGADTILSNPVQTVVVERVEGCTEPAASNYDPAATVDDGSCQLVPRTLPGFTGALGPDLSAQGLTQCAGTSNGSITSAAFLTPCQGASTLRFGCSVGNDETAEYLTPFLPSAGRNLTDATCDAWSSGALTPYATGHILSFDAATPPACANYNVSYDLYMDMVSPQWGCNGTQNTHNTGGRMFAYRAGPGVVFGCTDPAASNYSAGATHPDDSCLYGVVPGFTGAVGPALSGWLQCGGIDAAGASSTDLLAGCEGYSEVRFACSTDAGTTAEYTSPGMTTVGALLDATCNDFTFGALSPYGPGHILSIDDTNPACDVFNVSFDLYADMVNGQWGCAGVANTHVTGGSIWAYVR